METQNLPGKEFHDFKCNKDNKILSYSGYRIFGDLCTYGFFVYRCTFRQANLNTFPVSISFKLM